MTLTVDMVSAAAIITALASLALRFIDKSKCERDLREARRELGDLRRTFTTLLWLAPEPKADQLKRLLDRVEHGELPNDH